MGTSTVIEAATGGTTDDVNGPTGEDEREEEEEDEEDEDEEEEPVEVEEAVEDAAVATWEDMEDGGWLMQGGRSDVGKGTTDRLPASTIWLCCAMRCSTALVGLGGPASARALRRMPAKKALW